MVQKEGDVGRLGERYIQQYSNYNNIRINDHFPAYDVDTCSTLADC